MSRSRDITAVTHCLWGPYWLFHRWNISQTHKGTWEGFGKEISRCSNEGSSISLKGQTTSLSCPQRSLTLTSFLPPLPFYVILIQQNLVLFPAARYSGKFSFLPSELQTTFTPAKSRACLLVVPGLLTVDRLVCFDFDISNLARLQIPGSAHTRVHYPQLYSHLFSLCSLHSTGKRPLIAIPLTLVGNNKPNIFPSNKEKGK